ncbi:hypothetical protein, partial [Thiolapillus sp.]|uniref:hypothetical protein n=1 Tax=Thiolapillus sp. TaxID=2017437 RepID=UPI003AF4298F
MPCTHPVLYLQSLGVQQQVNRSHLEGNRIETSFYKLYTSEGMACSVSPGRRQPTGRANILKVEFRLV